MPDDTRRDSPSTALATALIATMDDRHEDMVQLLAGLPAGALDWRPAAEASSLAGLTRHILDVEGHVLRELGGGDPAWAGANGSQIDAPSDAALLVRLVEEIGRGLRLLLARIPATDAGGLAAALEEFDHCAMHWGQMQLTRHLWEAAHPAAASRYHHWR